MILIVSGENDLHATEVLNHLTDIQAEAKVVDLSSLPMAASITIDYENGCRPGAELQPVGGRPTDLTGASAVWWRRPAPVELPPMGDNETTVFSYNEWEAALTGLWHLVPGFWINEPTRDLVASRKAYQLAEAARAGLKIPRTVITSDPERARRFIESVGRERTIYKVFSATRHTWRETRLLRESEMSLIDQVQLAPVIFQEYIPADVDLRITIVGPEIFPAAIHSQTSEYKVDFRVGMDDMDIDVAVLPPEVEAGLRNLMDRLGLVYGAVDMRRTPSGEHVFLEVNTAGQWLFVEYATGQPIARALARRLSQAGA